MPFHSNLGAGNNHVPYNWTYNTEAARVADSGFVPSDEGKLARQLDNNSLWMLSNATTAEWVAVGSSGALANESYTNFSYSTVTPLKIGTVQSNKRLIAVDVYLDAPFNPTLNDASLTVGTLADGDMFIADADIDIAFAGTSEFAFSYKVSVDTDIYLNIVPGTATTTGSGMIVVRSEP